MIKSIILPSAFEVTLRRQHTPSRSPFLLYRGARPKRKCLISEGFKMQAFWFAQAFKYYTCQGRQSRQDLFHWYLLLPVTKHFNVNLMFGVIPNQDKASVRLRFSKNVLVISIHSTQQSLHCLHYTFLRGGRRFQKLKVQYQTSSMRQKCLFSQRLISTSLGRKSTPKGQVNK